MQKWKTFVLMLLMLVVLGACASAPPQTVGFLNETGHFRHGEEGTIDRYWVPDHVRSKADLKQMLMAYDNIIVDPVYFSEYETQAYDGLKYNELRQISYQMGVHFKSVLREHFKVVTKPQGKTLRVTVVLSAVDSANPILATTSSVLPVGLALSTISKLTTGEHTNVGSATIEATVTDAETGERLVAVIDRHAGDKDLGTITDPLDDAKDAIKWWASKLQETLNS